MTRDVRCEIDWGIVRTVTPRFMFRVSQGALLCVLLAGCAIPQVPSRTVYEDPTNFVRLEIDSTVLPEWPPSAHSHPASISIEDMAHILRQLKVQEHRIALQRMMQGDAPRVPAFSEEEIALLAPRLSEALAQAKPNERVTFYLSYPQTSIKRVITTGGLYVRGTELHFILGNWRIVYGIPAYGMIYDRRYPMSPTAAKGFDLFFEQEAAVLPQKSSIWDRLLANEKDELVIDLSQAFPGAAAGDPVVRQETMNRPRSRRMLRSSSCLWLDLRCSSGM